MKKRTGMILKKSASKTQMSLLCKGLYMEIIKKTFVFNNKNNRKKKNILLI